MSTQTETRVAFLDPEVRRRGLLAMSPPLIAAWVVAVFTAILLWFSFSGIVGAALGAGVLGATLMTTVPFGDRGSYADRGIHAWREWRRRTRGEHIYWSVADRGDRTGRPSRRYEPSADPAWMHPVPLGRVEPLDLTGTGFDSLFILRHSNPGEGNYLSVVLEVEGLKGGLRSPAAYGAAWAQFGYLLAELAKANSFIRGTQQIHRTVGYDLTPHIEWYQGQLVNAGAELEGVVDSYWSVLEEIAPLAEEHRTWVVVKIPIDDRFVSEAAAKDSWGEGRRAEVGWAAVVKEELERFEGLLRGAGLGEVTILGERRTCAVIRALQDPSYPLDDDRDVDWESCWQSYFGEDDHVVVNDRWYTRIAHVPPGAIAPQPLGPLWLYPLLAGVEADEGSDTEQRSATIRTISVRMDFTPSADARHDAVKDVTQDAAASHSERKKGKVDDGSSDVMLTASQRRKQDLRPGSGIHGMTYAVWLSVTGHDPENLRRACLRVQHAAGNSAIDDLTWADDRHDVAQITTLPLCRGLAGTKNARTA